MTQGNFSNVKQYNGKTPAKTDNLSALISLLHKNQKAIQSALPKHLTPERICRVAVNTISKTPALLKCNPTTLCMAIIEASSLGLEIDGRGLAYLVPFGNIAQLIYGYKGMLDLAYRSGKVSSIMAEVVGKNDKFTAVFGLEQKLEHEPNLIDGRGEIIAAYAVAYLKDGSKQFVIVPRAELDKVKEASKSSSGPWTTWPEEMMKKVAIKRLCKMLPLSPEIQRAISIDDQADAGIAQSFCETIEESIIDLPIPEPAQEPNPTPEPAAEPTPETESPQGIDASYTFECPANGKQITEEACVSCKSRNGCPQWETV